jgi:hypothetical protein
MTDTTTKSATTGDELLALVEKLEGELLDHERAAVEIRDTLAGLRKRLNTAPGARAGKNARSGRKRKPKDKPLPFEVTDLTKQPLDARAHAGDGDEAAREAGAQG